MYVHIHIMIICICYMMYYDSNLYHTVYYISHNIPQYPITLSVYIYIYMCVCTIILLYTYVKQSRPGGRGKVVEGQLSIKDTQPFGVDIYRLRARQGPRCPRLWRLSMKSSWPNVQALAHQHSLFKGCVAECC